MSYSKYQRYKKQPVVIEPVLKEDKKTASTPKKKAVKNDDNNGK